MPVIARMPNGYHEKDAQGHVSWHEGPPRYGTVGMRATRFRLHAGLLSWKRRTGSDAKNAKILSLIPANCKDPRVNSTASHRNFTEAEQREVRKVLVGTAPARSRRYIKDDMRGGEQDLDGYEERNEATRDDVDEADEDEPRKLISGLQDRNANSAHFEDGGEKFSDTPVPAVGFSSNPILVKENPDRRAQGRIIKASHSASDSDQPLAKRQRTTHPKHLSNPIKNHTLDNLDGPTMMDADTEPTDYRYMDPLTHEEKQAIQQALELTREDFRQKTRMDVPPLLATKFDDEDYNSQRLRLQEVFSRVWAGSGRTPQLYRLPAWHEDFANWKIPDKEGMDLYSNVLE